MNDSSTQTDHDLYPSLKAALASLDLTPEAELAYYRQQRQLAEVANLPAEPAPISPDSDLVDLSALDNSSEDALLEQSPEGNRNTPSEPALTEPPITDEELTNNLDPTEHSPSAVEGAPENATRSAPPSAIDTDIDPPSIPDPSAGPDQFPNEEVITAELEPIHPDTITADTSAIITHPDTDLTTTEATAMDELAMIEIDTDPDAELEAPDALATPALPPSDFPQSYENYLDPSIEDYLESSEALLRHLEESTSTTDSKRTSQAPPPATTASSVPRKGTKNQLRRFWILVGLLVLFSILGVGGLLFWRFNLWNRLKWWSTPSPQPVSPVPTPAIPEIPSPSPPTDLLLPTPTLSVPSPSVSAQPSPASPSVAPSPSDPATTSQKFYVVTELNASQSLADIRKIVPQAAEATFGDRKRIQLGVRSSRDAAEALVEELNQKGLQTSIIPPQ